MLFLGEFIVGDGFEVGGDLAVKHMNNSSSVNGKGGIMGDHNNSVAGGMDIFEFFHDESGTMAVEITGGLVGENDFWVVDERTGDGDTLFLAAGKLGGEIILTIFKIEAGEKIRSLDEARSFTVARIEERKGDIFESRESRDEIKVLKDEADFTSTERCFMGGGKTVDRETIQEVGAVSWMVKKTEDVK